MFASGKLNPKLYVVCEMVDPRFNCSGVPSITSLAHSLQRVIHDSMLAQNNVQDLLASGRSITSTQCCLSFITEKTGPVGAKKSVYIVPGRANQVEQQLLHAKEVCGAKKGCKCC